MYLWKLEIIGCVTLDWRIDIWKGSSERDIQLCLWNSRLLIFSAIVFKMRTDESITTWTTKFVQNEERVTKWREEGVEKELRSYAGRSFFLSSHLKNINFCWWKWHDGLKTFLVLNTNKMKSQKRGRKEKICMQMDLDREAYELS